MREIRAGNWVIFGEFGWALCRSWRPRREQRGFLLSEKAARRSIRVRGCCLRPLLSRSYAQSRRLMSTLNKNWIWVPSLLFLRQNDIICGNRNIHKPFLDSGEERKVTFLILDFGEKNVHNSECMESPTSFFFLVWNQKEPKFGQNHNLFLVSCEWRKTKKTILILSLQTSARCWYLEARAEMEMNCRERIERKLDGTSGWAEGNRLEVEINFAPVVETAAKESTKTYAVLIT